MNLLMCNEYILINTKLSFQIQFMKPYYIKLCSFTFVNAYIIINFSETSTAPFLYAEKLFSLPLFTNMHVYHTFLFCALVISEPI